ncbi:MULTISPECIES: hypothetical protein [Aeromonas]|uniref:hypothetical protein n=1 Tax=Aeromonas TaxID=642 RepID=UPI0009E39643|nr:MULTISPECIES: hypothetical protein [Aeromonas]MBS4642218.1 hypothetical protein [Aeromonas media]MCE9958317.1 hypothetical protein [Aeromonas rivipollensis]
MGKTQEEHAASADADAVSIANQLATQQLTFIRMKKLLSHLSCEDEPEIQDDVVDCILTLKRVVERNGCKLSLFIHMPDGTHHGVNF